MNCQTCCIEIEELELGEGPGREASAHLESCASCRAFHDERLSLRRLVGSLGPVSAPPDFEFRLRARLNAAGNGSNRRFSFRSLISSAPALAVAASFALLVAAVVVYKQLKPAQMPSGQAASVTNQSSLGQSGVPAFGPDREVSAPKDVEGDSPRPVLVAGSKSPNENSMGSVQPRVKKSQVGMRGNDSVDSALKPAPRITQAGGTPFVASAGQPVRLPVRSPSQAVKVLVDDRGGNKRTVTLEPVIFGSQDFIGRNAPQQAAPQGIW